LVELGRLIAREQEVLAALIAVEVGKPLAEAGDEVARTAHIWA
jgi:acyl-CoA reductase-like NAD-dependent aldehyde dehydrogenase